MKARVSENLCIGCGACAAIAPEIFELNDNGVSEVINALDEENIEKAKEAEESCPTNAITVNEE